ncbi:MAG: DNA-binding protein [Verrucomicrobia bacterium]|nr:DNA-binding protein [Verrucomicrobiota bacterium]
MKHRTNNTPDHHGQAEALITRRELAKLCKVSTRTVDNWIASKRIPFLRGPSERCVRFAWSEVIKSLQHSSCDRK